MKRVECALSQYVLAFGANVFLEDYETFSCHPAKLRGNLGKKDAAMHEGFATAKIALKSAITISYALKFDKVQNSSPLQCGKLMIFRTFQNLAKGSLRYLDFL